MIEMVIADNGDSSSYIRRKGSEFRYLDIPEALIHEVEKITWCNDEKGVDGVGIHDDEYTAWIPKHRLYIVVSGEEGEARDAK